MWLPFTECYKAHIDIIYAQKIILLHLIISIIQTLICDISCDVVKCPAS